MLQHLKRRSPICAVKIINTNQVFKLKLKLRNVKHLWYSKIYNDKTQLYVRISR